ncbi:MAG: sodium:calcium antiporter [Bacteroidota bacterium]|nr:sodium:calcium antiporter [Bacteroidota bacterium]
MLISQLPSVVLILFFLVASAAIWIAGVKITNATDHITSHYQLGEAFGGMVFLAIVTNLPEIAITIAAAIRRDYVLAISNILGGIAIQTVVLVIIDAFGVGRTAPLTAKGHSKILMIEGVALIFILALVMMGKQFSPQFHFFRTTPFEWFIAGVWLGSIAFIDQLTKKKKPKHISADMQEESALDHPHKPRKRFKGSVSAAFFVFGIGALVTLFCGWYLELSSEILSQRYHISGVIFGGTVLALSTGLPEISTGIASAKIKEYQMAVSDIFGGNAFLPVLFLMASLISGDAILPDLQPSDMYLTGLGILLTGVYMIGMLINSKKQFLRLGVDSIIVLLLYILGLVGLFYLD